MSENGFEYWSIPMPSVICLSGSSRLRGSTGKAGASVDPERKDGGKRVGVAPAHNGEDPVVVLSEVEGGRAESTALDTRRSAARGGTEDRIDRRREIGLHEVRRDGARRADSRATEGEG